MKKKSVSYVFSCILLLLLLPPPAVHSQASVDAFLEWSTMRKSVVPPNFADAADRDLASFRALVGDGRVVAYGEPTHGAHEPLAFRNRLFRYLVENMDFTAIAIESGFTEAEAINRYINTGSGDLTSTVRQGISWGFGNFGENEELVAWMRAYNADPAHKRKLRFYGIDLSGSGNGAFPNARIAVDAAVASLERSNPTLADSLRKQLESLLDRFATGRYYALAPGERGRLESALKALAMGLAAEHPHNANHSDISGEWARRNVAVAMQLKHMLDVYPPPATTPGIPPDAFRAATVRDSAMAENVRWALEREGPAGRIMVFAHNNHVMNAPLAGGPWSAFREPPSTMGMFLRSLLDNELVIIGSTIGATSDGLPPVSADGSIDDALARVSSSSFMLNLRAAREDPAAWQWLSQPHPLRSNVATHAVVPPGKAFDAVLFIDNISPSRARARR